MSREGKFVDSVSFSLLFVGKTSYMIKWLQGMWDITNANKFIARKFSNEEKFLKENPLESVTFWLSLLLLLNFVWCMCKYSFVHDCSEQWIIFVPWFFCSIMWVLWLKLRLSGRKYLYLEVIFLPMLEFLKNL